MNDQIDRSEACLLGLALGDALGAPLRGMKDGHILQTAGELRGLLDPLKIFPQEPRHWRLRGLYGLPAQLALLIADVLIDRQYTAAALVQKIRQIGNYKNDAHNYTGAFRATDVPFRKALQKMSSGECGALDCGEAAPGLLPASMIAPAGLYFCEQPDPLAAFVIQAALPLYRDPRAVAGAFAVAAAIGLLTRETNATDKKISWLAELIESTRAFEERIKEDCWDHLDPSTRITGAYQMSEALRVLPALLREKNDDLAQRSIVQQVNRFDCGGEIKSANIDFAPAAVTFALYYGLTNESFPEGLLKIIRAGRETQMLGAITGAVLGLRLGAEWIPAEWIAELQQAEQFRLSARILAGNEHEVSFRENLAAAEYQLTRREIEHFTEPLKKLAHDTAYQEQKRASRAKKRAAEKSSGNKPQGYPSNEILPFAPPPETWLSGGATLDPLAKKREKDQRAKRRIGWKEERREKKRKGK